MQDVYYINADIYYFSCAFYIYIKYGYSLNFLRNNVFAFLLLHLNFEKKLYNWEKLIDWKTSVDDVTREINCRRPRRRYTSVLLFAKLRLKKLPVSSDPNGMPGTTLGNRRSLG